MTEVPPLVIPDPTLSLYIESVQKPIFSCDGQYLAGVAKAHPDQNFVRIWRIENGEFVEKISDLMHQEITCMAFSPTDPRVIAIAIENDVHFYEIKDEGHLECFKTVQHGYRVASFDFFPDGTSILIISRYGSIRVVPLKEGKRSARLRYRGIVRGTLMAQNGEYFLCVKGDGRVSTNKRLVWNWWIEKQLCTVKNDWNTDVIALSPDSRAFAFKSGDTELTVMDLKEKRSHTIALEIHRNFSIQAIAFTSCGRFLLVGIQKVIRVIDLLTREIIKSIQKFSLIRDIACSPNGRYVAVRGVAHGEQNHGLVILDFGVNETLKLVIITFLF